MASFGGWRRQASYPSSVVHGVSSTTNASASSRIIAIHSAARWRAHFDASKLSTQLMVIDFTATWCKPCRLMEPAIEEMAAKFTDVGFVKIDVDELMEVARAFEVQAMPSFLLIKQGKVVDKVVGTKKDELQRKIEKHKI
ncbi:hypothetical protein HHK36_029719 [Tetracentron sinense]|uniref:Thioredoxin domain-containing protein n=1 Tax=Tetracentron sinense TaxID=13715 RepID=A0A834YDF4_TETSI|nr:hypothetical protein HHK36_029719 [Tetracentron sinense]